MGRRPDHSSVGLNTGRLSPVSRETISPLILNPPHHHDCIVTITMITITIVTITIAITMITISPHHHHCIVIITFSGNSSPIVPLPELLNTLILQMGTYNIYFLYIYRCPCSGYKVGRELASREVMSSLFSTFSAIFISICICDLSLPTPRGVRRVSAI